MNLSQPASPSPAATPPTAAPWWRFGMVWLVWSGPAVVVVASFVTLALALSHGDPVIGDEPALPKAAHGTAFTPVTPATPAMQARNHAATPAR